MTNDRENSYSEQKNVSSQANQSPESNQCTQSANASSLNDHHSSQINQFSHAENHSVPANHTSSANHSSTINHFIPSSHSGTDINSSPANYSKATSNDSSLIIQTNRDSQFSSDEYQANENITSVIKNSSRLSLISEINVPSNVDGLEFKNKMSDENVEKAIHISERIAEIKTKIENISRENDVVLNNDVSNVENANKRRPSMGTRMLPTSKLPQTTN